MKPQQPRFAHGADFVTLLDLVRRTAQYLGVVHAEGSEDAQSKSIAQYPLDDRTLALLVKNGFEHVRERGVFCLSDQTIHQTGSIHLGTYWNFRYGDRDRKDDPLYINLSVGFGIRKAERAMTVVPRAHGPFLSASHPKAHQRLFHCLVELHPEGPEVLKKVDAAGERLFVPWADLGLAGIRSIHDLFGEFSRDKEEIKRLSHHRLFDPAPQEDRRKPGDEPFFAERVHRQIFEGWRGQLEEYRQQLAV